MRGGDRVRIMWWRAGGRRRLALGLIAAAAVSAGCPATALAGSWTALVVGDSTASNAVAPINVSDDSVGSLIGTGNNPFGLDVSADASTAYVDDYNTNNGGTDGITAVDLAESPPSSSFIPTDPNGGTFKPLSAALAPNGSALWAVYPPSGEVEKIDLTTDPPKAGTPFSDGTTDGAGAIALSPSGTTAWVTDGNEGQVTLIDISGSTPTPVTTIAVGSKPFDTCVGAPGSSSSPFGIAVSPDGSKVYVADNGSDQLSVINTATRKVSNVNLPAGGGAYELAVSPDGSTVYVTQPCDNDVVPVSVSGTPSAGTPIPVSFPNDSGGQPFGIAISPDARHLYVGDGNGDQTVDISLPSDNQTTITTGVQDDRWITVTPDQAPIANFTVAPAAAGQATQFDASSSTVAVGGIASYAWNFGDGTSTTTSSPTVSHVYAASGTYTATVTETDTAGTSTTQVYTGQSVLRDGGPSAEATKSVIVGAAPQPAVQLSATTLDFGQRSAPSAQGLTIANTGAAPLHISSSAITGSAARDYTLSNDGCTGQMIGAGSSCGVTVNFAPSAVGSRAATLAFYDNASGSPHTVSLAGVGEDEGVIHGVVTDATKAGNPPLAGVQILICPNDQWNLCTSVSTAADGSYTFTGPPATYRLLVYAPDGLAWQSAYAPLAVLETQTEDFALVAPQSTSPGLTVNGQSGVLGWSPWGQPDSSQTELDAPTGKPAGTLGATLVSFFNEPSGGSPLHAAAQSATGYILVYYRYDSEGVPRFLADVPYVTGTPPTPPSYSVGSWTVTLGAAPVVGGTDVRGMPIVGVLTPASGQQYDGGESELVSQAEFLTTTPGAAGGRASSSQVASLIAKLGSLKEGLFTGVSAIAQALGLTEVEPQAAARAASSGGEPGALVNACDEPVQLPTEGDSPPSWELPNFYRALPATGSVWNDQGRFGVQPSIPGTDEPLTVSPYDTGGTSLEISPGNSVTVDQGQTTITNNTDGTWSLTDPTGDYTFDPQAGTFTYTPAGTNSGPQTYPSSTPSNNPDCNPPEEADPYKDPSGIVRTRAGVPIPGARVTLEVAKSRGGPFRAVPNGSTIMSPSNRRDPFLTGPGGLFGWDVLTGFYRIVATHRGCTAPRGGRLARTRVLKVPPPAKGLSLILSCANLRRVASKVSLTVKRLPDKQLLLLIRVRGRVAHQYGLVQAVAGRRVLETVPIDPRSGRAEITIAAADRKRVTVRYEGDGYALPSTTSAAVPRKILRR